MKKEKEIDPYNGIIIDDDNVFGFYNEIKVEDFSDFIFKYFRPFYRLFVNYIPDGCRAIKWALQRFFRKSGCADVDIWNISHHMAPTILKKLKAFRENQEKYGHGHPFYFSEWGCEGCEDQYGGMGMLKKEYDKARSEGEFGGGGSEAWLATVDEMIFAFEYNLFHDSFNRKQDQFFQKWGLVNPYRETEDNLSWGYNFKKEAGTHMSCGEKDFENIEDLKKEGWIPINKHRSYIDVELLREYGARASKGMEFFGKFYWNLWD